VGLCGLFLGEGGFAGSVAVDDACFCVPALGGACAAEGGVHEGDDGGEVCGVCGAQGERHGVRLAGMIRNPEGWFCLPMLSDKETICHRRPELLF
jgi:hypothetical protein